jgi:hypothetical protein
MPVMVGGGRQRSGEAVRVLGHARRRESGEMEGELTAKGHHPKGSVQ